MAVACSVFFTVILILQADGEGWEVLAWPGLQVRAYGVIGELGLTTSMFYLVQTQLHSHAAGDVFYTVNTIGLKLNDLASVSNI